MQLTGFREKVWPAGVACLASAPEAWQALCYLVSGEERGLVSCSLMQLLSVPCATGCLLLQVCKV